MGRVGGGKVSILSQSQISLEGREVVCPSVELPLRVSTCACRRDPDLLVEDVHEATAV